MSDRRRSAAWLVDGSVESAGGAFLGACLGFVGGLAAGFVVAAVCAGGLGCAALGAMAMLIGMALGSTVSLWLAIRIRGHAGAAATAGLYLLASVGIGALAWRVFLFLAPLLLLVLLPPVALGARRVVLAIHARERGGDR